MNRHHLEFPGKIQKDAANEEKELFANEGTKFEKKFLEKLQTDGLNVCVMENGSDAGNKTLQAMQQGPDIIYQAAIGHENFKGFADFLHKMKGASKWGAYHYEPWDTKLALKSKPYFIIQLCCYAEILEALQGLRPKHVTVVLRDGKESKFRTNNFYYFYLELKKAFLEQMAAFDPKIIPEPIGNEDFRNWSKHAEKILEDADHLIRVANIKVSQIKKLRDAGINTLTALTQTELAHVKKLEPNIFNRLKIQARLQLASKNLDKPLFEVIVPIAHNPRRGLALLPPASAKDIFFDMEGYTLIEGGLEYLFGITHVEDEENKFIDFWGHNRAEEKKAFENFIDWVGQRYKQDAQMHIYHYGNYEIAAVRRLAQRHGTREAEVDNLLRSEIFIDLYQIVKQGLLIGEPKYSIKNLEHLYQEARSGDVKTAGASLVYYQRWLEEQDGPTWQESKILCDIRDYNRDDCDSTLLLTEWLRALQIEKSISFIPQRAIEDSPPHEISDAEKLAQRLLAEIPEDKSAQPEKWRVQALLAHLLLFHKREEKPVWWAMFDRHAMSDEELIEDIDCLGGLQRTTRAAEAIKKSTLYEYSFDPDQDTKLTEGQGCYFAHDLTQSATIEYLDIKAGIVKIKLGPKAQHPPAERLALIPQENVPAKAITDSIYRTVLNYEQTGALPKALNDFLFRIPPQIKRGATSLTEIAIQTVENLEESTLCIQGPPGCGKTFTGAEIILQLLKNGKRVGIASNGHKAISNLMKEVAKKAVRDNFNFRGVKVAGDEHDELFNYSSITYLEKTAAYINRPQNQAYLVGATAWVFSRAEVVGTFDYLFVDEAGQVALANLVGMAPSTKNIVLLGDQMQLGQPVRGSHPEESGLSVLDYLLQDHATIPEDLGIFLPTTYRMHPDVCAFISEMVYEGRLASVPDTKNQRLNIPKPRHLIKNSGVLFIPVNHEGNTQGSDEEIAVIQEITQELLGSSFTDAKGKTRILSPQDILYVAPYNMQVNRLKQALGEQARVGSVDKFQGQEAPVVILSMCASNAEGSPRGIEFLFNKNRLNVAISRAQCLAIVVGNPALARTNCSSIKQMEMVNLFCRLMN
ncbi:MAG: hypothetical protein ACD_73C00273G0001 [uncultured bacterium]|nr:MAG: hypothetical protein ACD_73C00273G0001 [uncultured bacterium]